MLARSYLKVAYRNLVRQKGYTFISVAGLALGIACCLMFFAFVHDEWTHDEFHAKADRIFRVNLSTATLGASAAWKAGGPAPLGPALERTFPEVKTATRLAREQVRLEKEGEPIKQQALFADVSFFEVFNFPLRSGHPQTVLSDPKGVVLTQSAAHKYFGDDNPVGKPLTVRIEDEALDMRVAGVVEDPPVNSSIQFDLVLPFEAKKYAYSEMFREMAFRQWDFSVASTFVLLSNSSQAEPLEAKLSSFATQHFNEDASNTNTSERGTKLRLQPLTDVHLNPSVRSAALKPPNDPRYAYLLAGAALLILFIACINFATLTLGRSASRTTEVGVRKALGAYRRQIANQFWSEAVLTCGLALFFGLVLSRLLLPVFNRLVEKELQLGLFSEPTTILFIAGLALMIAFLAGSYPALMLAHLQPARVLHGHARVRGRGRLTRALVVVQFTLSIGFVAGALIMSAQLRYMQTDLGFEQENIIRITGLGDSNTGKRIYLPFRREAMRHRAVEAVMGVGYAFFSGSGRDVPIRMDDATAPVRAYQLSVGKNFVEGMGIELAAGRDFSKQRSDADAVLVNETLVRAMGWKSAIGKEIALSRKVPFAKIFGTKTVVGVVKNFHTQSLRHEIQPLILTTRGMLVGGLTAIYVRIRPDDVPGTLSFLEETWRRAAPDRPFRYTFLDEVVEATYQAERRQRTTMRYAAGLALLIACFGLFGLASLTVARRTKEIGIRKVLGASVTSIVALLLKDVLKLVTVAFLLAVPGVYLAASWWLQGFAYRLELGPAPFFIAGGAVGLVALLTVSYQAVTTALADPVGSLRDE